MQALFQLSYSPTIHAQLERLTGLRSLVDRSESLPQASAAHHTTSALPGEGQSFGRHCLAANLSPRTIETYTEAATQLAIFHGARSERVMPVSVSAPSGLGRVPSWWCRGRLVTRSTATLRDVGGTITRMPEPLPRGNSQPPSDGRLRPMVVPGAASHDQAATNPGSQR